MPVLRKKGFTSQDAHDLLGGAGRAVLRASVLYAVASQVKGFNAPFERVIPIVAAVDLLMSLAGADKSTKRRLIQGAQWVTNQ